MQKIEDFFTFAKVVILAKAEDLITNKDKFQCLYIK